jgi:hypothetical protein
MDDQRRAGPASSDAWFAVAKEACANDRLLLPSLVQAGVSGTRAETLARRAEQQPGSSNIDGRELQPPSRDAIATPTDRIAPAGTTTKKPHPGSIQSGAPPEQFDAAGSVLGASSRAAVDALRPNGRRGDTAGYV